MMNGNELEALYVERAEVEARIEQIKQERGYDKMSDTQYSNVVNSLDYYDEYVQLDDQLYIITRAIDELEWQEYVAEGGFGVEEYIDEDIVEFDMIEDYLFEDEPVLSEETKERRRGLYTELRSHYLNDVWKGEYNEISDTLDCYEESVVHYGEGVDFGFTFLLDELENYGEYKLIEQIKRIVNSNDIL